MLQSIELFDTNGVSLGLFAKDVNNGNFVNWYNILVSVLKPFKVCINGQSFNPLVPGPYQIQNFVKSGTSKSTKPKSTKKKVTKPTLAAAEQYKVLFTLNNNTTRRFTVKHKKDVLTMFQDYISAGKAVQTVCVNSKYVLVNWPSISQVSEFLGV